MTITELSRNLTVAEGIRSATAKARGIDNTPSLDVLKNMRYTAETIFQKTRDHFGDHRIHVSSFYRSPDLNVAVGGSRTSQHCRGEALDLDGDVYGYPSNKQIFEFIRDCLEFDQLIIEGIKNGRMDWVHVSRKRTGNRKQILFMYKNAAGKTIYENYNLTRYRELIT